MNNAEQTDKPILKASKQQGDVVTHEYEGGLTKRERFAMAAMQGLLSNKEIHTDMNEIVKKGNNPLKDLAIASAELADALLNELED